MQLYEVLRWEGANPSYHLTLAEAHATAKDDQWDDTVIRLFDYRADRGVFCDLFNGERPKGKALRRWRLTPRGGLREVPVNPDDEVREVIPAPKGKP